MLLSLLWQFVSGFKIILTNGADTYEIGKIISKKGSIIFSCLFMYVNYCCPIMQIIDEYIFIVEFKPYRNKGSKK